jgi:hypothetical protein
MQCTATSKKTDQQCKRRAVVGYTVCQVHGAGSAVQGREGGRPATHGRYSRLKRNALRDLIAEYERDPNPLDILPELAATRALFQDYIERYDEWREALLAWHASFASDTNPSPKPREVLDIADAYRLLSEATKIVQRIEAIRAQNAVSRKELSRILQEMTRVVDLEVGDDGIKQRIRDGWLSIRLA